MDWEEALENLVFDLKRAYGSSHESIDRDASIIRAEIARLRASRDKWRGLAERAERFAAMDQYFDERKSMRWLSDLRAAREEA